MEVKSALSSNEFYAQDNVWDDIMQSDELFKKYLIL